MQFALDMSILVALSKAIPDRESAVQTGKAPSRRRCALKNAIFLVKVG